MQARDALHGSALSFKAVPNAKGPVSEERFVHRCGRSSYQVIITLFASQCIGAVRFTRSSFLVAFVRGLLFFYFPPFGVTRLIPVRVPRFPREAESAHPD